MNEPKTYSAADIERYHNGGMTAAEMHLLEKAALGDPMLADALEGYAGVATASTDLQLLQQRLQKRIEKDDRRRVLMFGSTWLKVAAVFLLFAGGGWLAIQMFSEKGTTLANGPANEVLTVDKNSSAQKTGLDSGVLNFSTTADSSAKNRDVAMAETKAPSYKTKMASPATALQREAKADAMQDKEPESETVSRSLAKAEGRTKVADSDRISPGNGTANVTVRVLNDSTKQVNVVLKKLDATVDEVVISKAKTAPRARSVPVIVDSLEPDKGWTSFDDYVAENLKAPDELKTKPTYNKEVELSFDVDGEGNPTNVKVTKSLCEKCDAEAIRLLKEGPKWKGKKAKGKVKIRFPLFP